MKRKLTHPKEVTVLAISRVDVIIVLCQYRALFAVFCDRMDREWPRGISFPTIPPWSRNDDSLKLATKTALA